MSVLIAPHPEEQRQDTVKQIVCAREGAVEPHGWGYGVSAFGIWPVISYPDRYLTHHAAEKFLAGFGPALENTAE